MKRSVGNDSSSTRKSPKLESTDRGDLHTRVCDASFLSDVVLSIIPAGIGKARTDVFCRQTGRFGGKYHVGTLFPDTQYVVVDETMEFERLCRILQVAKNDELLKKVKIVNTRWLSACLKERKLLEYHEFEIKKPEETTATPDYMLASTSAEGVSSSVAITNVKKSKKSAEYSQLSNQSSSGSEGDEAAEIRNKDQNSKPGDSDFQAKQKPKGNWVCARSSADQLAVNHNHHITEKLEMLAKTYKNTKDSWRALAYQKAITALKAYKKPIESWKEAQSLTGVGKKMADKIWEIVESGTLRKLDNVMSDERTVIINLFNDVWGAGPSTAEKWVALGCKTLEDVQRLANPNHQQQVGLKHFHDFLDRMPREEAAEIERTVKDVAAVVAPGIIAHACGSYRRGKLTCGDVDVLITHPDGKSHQKIFPKIIDYLHKTGFLTDDLVTTHEGNQQKYLGVCRLPGEQRKYRRLDIISVPYEEYACALLYFTGSAHFNRSMRLLAKKMGMTLSEHSLNSGVVRKRNEKVYGGHPLKTPTEESVFHHLGLEYRKPEERDHYDLKLKSSNFHDSGKEESS